MEFLKQAEMVNKINKTILIGEYNIKKDTTKMSLEDVLSVLVSFGLIANIANLRSISFTYNKEELVSLLCSSYNRITDFKTLYNGTEDEREVSFKQVFEYLSFEIISERVTDLHHVKTKYSVLTEIEITHTYMVSSIIEDLVTKNTPIKLDLVGLIGEYLLINRDVIDIEDIVNNDIKRWLLVYSDQPFKSSEELFSVYAFKEGVQFIKNNRLMDRIKYPSVINDILTRMLNSDPKDLSVDFNRHKKLWLSLRASREYMSEIDAKRVTAFVNKISKLSKKYHMPLKKKALEVSFDLDIHEFRVLVQKSSIRELAKLYKYYKRLAAHTWPAYRVHIRNGLVKDVFYNGHDLNPKRRANIVKGSIKEKVAAYLEENNLKGFWVPKDYINYALPISPVRNFAWYTEGTLMEITYKNNLKCGITWQNGDYEKLDLDARLTLLELDNNIITDAGYGARHKDSSKVYFSGDVTNAVKPVSELFSIMVSENYYAELAYTNFSRGDKAYNIGLVLGETSEETLESNMDLSGMAINERSTISNGPTIGYNVCSIFHTKEKTELLFNPYGTTANVISKDKEQVQEGYHMALDLKDSYVRLSELDVLVSNNEKPEKGYINVTDLAVMLSFSDFK